MKKYQIIVVDPPWQVKKIQSKQRPNQVEMDYSMMSISEIKELPIQSIADENSWCFLWTTQKYLWESKDILEKWGFNHKLTMVWEKTYGRSAGMALYGFRWNAEFILVGTMGKKDMFPKTKLIPAVFQSENIRHSQKPDRFYEMIEPLGENRVDIFARRKRYGWDAWGDEVASDQVFPQRGKMNKYRKMFLLRGLTEAEWQSNKDWEDSTKLRFYENETMFEWQTDGTLEVNHQK